MAHQPANNLLTANSRRAALGALAILLDKIGHSVFGKCAQRLVVQWRTAGFFCDCWAKSRTVTPGTDVKLDGSACCLLSWCIAWLAGGRRRLCA